MVQVVAATPLLLTDISLRSVLLQQRIGIGLRVSEAMMPMGVECPTRSRGSQVLFY